MHNKPTGRRIALAVVVLAVVGGCASKPPRGEVSAESSVVAPDSPSDVAVAGAVPAAD